jgi:hypothetical protein
MNSVNEQRNPGTEANAGSERCNVMILSASA